MKYIVLTKDTENKTYGIWNNDMCAFQYIYDWDGTETVDLEEANKIATQLNNK